MDANPKGLRISLNYSGRPYGVWFCWVFFPSHLLTQCDEIYPRDEHITVPILIMMMMMMMDLEWQNVASLSRMQSLCLDVFLSVHSQERLLVAFELENCQYNSIHIGWENCVCACMCWCMQGHGHMQANAFCVHGCFNAYSTNIESVYICLIYCLHKHNLTCVHPTFWFFSFFMFYM